jgi:hypothetical protein
MLYAGSCETFGLFAHAASARHTTTTNLPLACCEQGDSAAAC